MRLSTFCGLRRDQEHFFLFILLLSFFLSLLPSRTKKTVIVDVVIVNSVMWAEGWERGERGKSQRVGQLGTGVDGNSSS